MEKIIQVEIERLVKVQDALMSESKGPVFNAETICNIAQVIVSLANMIK